MNIHLFIIQLFQNYLLCDYRVLGSGLDPGTIMEKSPFFVEYAVK